MVQLFIAILVVVLASCPVFGDTSIEQAEYAYQRGSDLLAPYFVLDDRSAADPRTAKGRADITEGIRLLGIAVKANPQNWPALWQIGKGYQAVGKHSSAYDAFKRAHEINSYHKDVAREYMIECICVGKTEEAVQAAEAAKMSDSNDAGLVANLGLALLADGQLDRAHDAVKRALELAPNDPINRALLAEINAVKNGRKPANYCPR